MKLKHLLVIVPMGLALVLIAGKYYYSGPYTRSGRKEELLASAKLADSSVLFLVQRPNPSLFEPYTVELYRLYRNGTAETCLIGDEESYWWWGGLTMRDSKTVRVTSIGITECLYVTETGLLSWTDKSYPPHGRIQGDYASLSNKVFRLGYRF